MAKKSVPFGIKKGSELPPDIIPFAQAVQGGAVLLACAGACEGYEQLSGAAFHGPNGDWDKNAELNPE